MLLLCFLNPCFTSCSNDDCEDGPIILNQNQSYVANGIEEKLLLIMNDTSGEYKDGGYIIYSSEDHEFLVLSEFTYSLGNIFYSFTKRETCDTILTSSTHPKKAPSGFGWKKGGTCSSKLGALRLANKIASQIPQGSDFEVHAECNSDGSYTVWYRII